MANNFLAIDIAKIACFCIVVTALFAQQVERFVALEVADLTAIAFGAENRTTFRDCKGSNSSRRGWLVILGGVIPGAQRSPLRKKMLPFGCGVPQYSPTGTWQEKCDWNTRQPSRQVPEDDCAVCGKWHSGLRWAMRTAIDRIPRKEEICDKCLLALSTNNVASRSKRSRPRT